MAEVVRGAATQGRQIPTAFVADMVTHTEQMKPYRTSMKIDYDEGRSLEVETMVGNPLRIAKQAGVELPHIAMLYQQLMFLNNRQLRA